MQVKWNEQVGEYTISPLEKKFFENEDYPEGKHTYLQERMLPLSEIANVSSLPFPDFVYEHIEKITGESIPKKENSSATIKFTTHFKAVADNMWKDGPITKFSQTNVKRERPPEDS
jgi:hypothetical protein